MLRAAIEIGKLLLTVFLVLAVINFIIDLVSRRERRQQNYIKVTFFDTFCLNY